MVLLAVEDVNERATLLLTAVGGRVVQAESTDLIVVCAAKHSDFASLVGTLVSSEHIHGTGKYVEGSLGQSTVRSSISVVGLLVALRIVATSK